MIFEIIAGMYLLALLTRKWHIKFTPLFNADEQERVTKVHQKLMSRGDQMT